MEFAEYLSVTFNISKVVSAAVISALSPNNKWERNKIDAFNLIQAFVNGESMESVKVCTYTNNKRRAWAILSGDIEMLRKARKTHAFALNVGMMDESVVTIDKWMLRAFVTTSQTPKEVQTSVTPLQYDRLSTHFCKLARSMGYKPYELQAIIWVTIRNRWL
jgi:thermostable 8-oxoguanine DNA glycosylase